MACFRLISKKCGSRDLSFAVLENWLKNFVEHVVHRKTVGEDPLSRISAVDAIESRFTGPFYGHLTQD